MTAKKITFIALIVVLVSSCATLFNAKTENLTILTSVPSKIAIGNDTTDNFLTHQNLIVPRSEEPLNISTIDSTDLIDYSIRPINSLAYWLNLNTTMFAGFLIDKNNPKRYAYPKTIYIDKFNYGNKYLTYNPNDEIFSKHKNIIKFTPLKLLGLSNSGFELSLERKMGNSFSTQIMGSYLLPLNVWDLGDDFDYDNKGYRIGIEEKMYLKTPAPIGPYLGLEFNYLKNHYQDIMRFGIHDIYSDTTYNNTNYPDSIRIHKQTYSINLKFGYQYIINRFSIDFYVGLGARYKNVIHLDRINPNDELEMSRHPNFYYITNSPGKYWTISIPLNVRIGWTF